MRELIGSWSSRDVMACRGADAATFLQGQLSQDVAGLDVGASRWSLLLAPQGRVEAFLRVSRLADQEFVLDVEAGFGAAVVARLERFKIRVDCAFEPLDTWRCLEVRCSESGDDARAALDRLDRSSAAVVAHTNWPGVDGVDLLGPDVAVPECVVVDAEAVERLRVLASVPRLGAELDDQTIPAEGGAWLIDESVSFTKGCYVGQELVARVDSRGSNMPRRLRRLRSLATPPATVPVGLEVLAGGVAVGTVTSAAGDRALALLRRSVEPGDTVSIGGEPAVVEA